MKDYADDYQKGMQTLDYQVKQVIATIEKTYNIQIESGWYRDLRDAGKHRNERITNKHDYMVFVPLAE